MTILLGGGESVLYGGSAGAILCGADIGAAASFGERAEAEVSVTEIVSIGWEPLVIASPNGGVAELDPGQSTSRTA